MSGAMSSRSNDAGAGMFQTNPIRGRDFRFRYQSILEGHGETSKNRSRSTVLRNLYLPSFQCLAWIVQGIHPSASIADLRRHGY